MSVYTDQLPEVVISRCPILREGSSGEAVRAVQEQINRYWFIRSGHTGHYLQIAVDGVYGRLTRAAVMATQHVEGLVPDGVVGPQTYALLKIRCTGGQPAPPAPPSPPAPSPSPAPPPPSPEADQLTLFGLTLPRRTWLLLLIGAVAGVGGGILAAYGVRRRV